MKFLGLDRIKQKIIRRKYAYLMGTFVATAGILAGFYGAGTFGETGKWGLLQSLYCFAEKAEYGQILWRMIWWRGAIVAAYTFLSLFTAALPLNILMLLLLAGAWSIGWGCLLFVMQPLQYVWGFPVFLVLLVLQILICTELCAVGITQLKKNFRERSIPKTAVDIYTQAGGHYRHCMRCLIGICLLTLLEAALVFFLFATM